MCIDHTPVTSDKSHGHAYATIFVWLHRLNHNKHGFWEKKLKLHNTSIVVVTSICYQQTCNNHKQDLLVHICFWVSHGWILHLVQSGSVSAVNFTHTSCSKCALIFVVVCTGSAMLALQLYFSFIYTLRWDLFNNMRVKNTKSMPTKNSHILFLYPSSSWFFSSFLNFGMSRQE